MKVIAPSIYSYCGRNDIEISTIKRAGCYFTLSLIKKGDRMQKIEFRDVLNFSSPTSLDKYLKQWGVPISKSIFPYSYYKSVEELSEAIDFPPPEAFFNDLKQIPVDHNLYNTAKEEYNRRKNLPEDHKDKMHNMLDWLEYYNRLDTGPLVQAVVNAFTSFSSYFNIDPHQHYSLPSMAFRSMFENYNTNLPYAFSFDEKRDEIRRLFRANLIGGLSSVYCRHLDLSDEGNSPFNARHTPDGSPLTHAGFWDFNSMYLWAQRQLMPLGPGLLWEKNGRYFNKTPMTSGVSFGQIQWLFYLQATTYKGVQLEHAFYHGELEFDGWKPDGYVFIEGVHHFFEYLGNVYSMRYKTNAICILLGNHGTIHGTRCSPTLII